MKHKKCNLKKVIAMLCAVTLLPLGGFAMQKNIEANANEGTTTITNPAELEKWTIADVGLKTGKYGSVNSSTATSGTATGTNLDQKALTATVRFPVLTSGNANLFIGEYLDGFYFDARPEGVYFKHYTNGVGEVIFGKLDPATFNLDTLLGVNLKLTLTTEFVNDNGTTTDVNIGLYINDILYKGEYFTLTNVPYHALKQQISLYNHWARGSAETTIYVATPVKPIEEFEMWDIKTVSLPKKSANTTGVMGTATGMRQNNTAFRTKVTYPSGLSTGKLADMWIGQSNDGYLLRAYPDLSGTDGLLFYLRDNSGTYPLQNTYGTAYIILKPEDFNMIGSLQGQELEVVITSELVTEANGTTSAYVGLYINGNLYKNDYLVISKVYASGVSQNVQISTNDGSALIQVDRFPTNPSDLEAWDITTVGFSAEQSVTTNGYSGLGTTTGKSMDGTAFRAKVTFPSGLSSSHLSEVWFYGDNRAEGVGLRVHYPATTGERNLDFVIKNKANTWTTLVLTPEDFKMSATDSLVGKELDVILTTELVDETDGTTTAYFGLYLNGNLYKDDYIVIKNVDKARLVQDICGYNSFGNSNIILKTSPTKPGELEQWSIDTVGITDGSYLTATGTATGETLDKKVFVTKVKLPNASSTWREGQIWIGGAYGTGFYLASCDMGADTDKITLKFDGYGLNQAVYPSDFGLEAFIGAELDIMVTTEFVNNNGTTTDVKIGLYINNVCYNNQYMVVKNVPLEKLQQQVAINSNAGDVVVAATHLGFKDTGVSYTELAATGYALTTTGSIKANGVQKENGDKLTAIGDYRIVNTEATRTTTKTVVLWKTGAINKDGNVDVRDIIALKKLDEAGTNSLSRAVQKGADVDANGVVDTSADGNALRSQLVGK